MGQQLAQRSLRNHQITDLGQFCGTRPKGHRKAHGPCRAYIIDIIADNDIMATLNVRNLPDKVQQRLRVRAAKAGCSMEAEARKILFAALDVKSATTGPDDLQAYVDRLYNHDKPQGVVESLLCERRKEAKNE